MTTRADLQEFCHTNGYFAAQDLPDGRVAFLTATVVAQGQLCICQGIHPADAVTDRYSYPDLVRAGNALAAWRTEGYEGEPTGWHRHQPSNRRRDNGDPTTEEVRP